MWRRCNTGVFIVPVYLAIISEAEYPAFRAMGVTGLPANYGQWKHIVAVVEQAFPDAPRVRISLDGFSQWLSENDIRPVCVEHFRHYVQLRWMCLGGPGGTTEGQNNVGYRP